MLGIPMFEYFPFSLVRLPRIKHNWEDERMKKIQ